MCRCSTSTRLQSCSSLKPHSDLVFGFISASLFNGKGFERQTELLIERRNAEAERLHKKGRIFLLQEVKERETRKKLIVSDYFSYLLISCFNRLEKK